MNDDRFAWWNNLRHGGLLFDSQRLARLIPESPAPLGSFEQDRLRRKLQRFRDDAAAHRGELVSQVLESACGFSTSLGVWKRGGDVSTEWSRKAVTGESVRPRHLWQGLHGATLPVFIDDHPRLGVGRGQRIISQTLQWLRQGREQLALITNGQQWRLLFAGLDYEAFCEWDVDLWLTEGETSPEFQGFRSLIQPRLWTPAKQDDPAPLLAAINDSRKGQSDLSQVLGERVRLAVELLVQGHAPALGAIRDSVAAQEIYRAAVRVVMRMVVVLFAESREGLLPRDNPVFHSAYSLQGLREQLERTAPHRLKGNYAAWFRVLAMFRLIHEGSSHEALPVPAYGGELFAPGAPDSGDGMQRALSVFEIGCFEHDLMNDAQVREILVLLTRTKVRLRQGRASTWTTMPVDFSSLDSEYIGILYEGLLDFELKTAPSDQPVVFLALGNQPALPLATLEAMDDAAIRNLLEKMQDTSSDGDDAEESEAAEADAEADDGDNNDSETSDEDAVEDDEAVAEETAEIEPDDVRHTTRARAEAWAQRACLVGGLAKKPRGKTTPEKQLQFEAELARKAKQVVPRVVLPGEWYLVRWGGTRKGSGTFYTRPQLAIPTVHRTLRPLAYDPPLGKDGQPDLDAPLDQWTPKPPEQILDLKVCDPACGSGTFPLAALRFLTQALYASLQHHGRIRESHGRALLSLIQNTDATHSLAEEALPCRPDDEHFEPRTRAVLRRYVVERCIYGVDFDPLAVELCRLSLWIETLDRRLPFTFLDHKIKPGNSLVGAWFDQFLHYPIMAWAREGGDKNHTNGVHYQKEAWTKAIAEFDKQARHDLKAFIDGGRLSFAMDLCHVQTGHDAAEQALREIHELGIAQVGERAAKYVALRSSPEFQKLKDAFDLWCALWFWPPDQLTHAPLPTDFAKGELSEEARGIVRDLARQRRFFHWELEFPDVFSTTSHGFRAILGNPPWDISKPNSKEFFSAVDPLYRSYGKQEAVEKQKFEFERRQTVERDWLDYSAYFKSMSNWVKYAGYPFGDRITTDGDSKSSFDCNLGDGGRSTFATAQRRHQRWKQKREEASGYADADHPFRYQGSADINLYKLFLERAHSLLAAGGRLGLVVPSGVYSDDGCTTLRSLMLRQCMWEWVFSFTNTQKSGGKVFDIHPSYKFNPIIVLKGGHTKAIRVAFLRRELADWEAAEQYSTMYPSEQIERFSPKSLALLETQMPSEAVVLNTLYSRSVLLSDNGASGWHVEYRREFDMTNQSKLFPPISRWVEWGYRVDEYSRWLKGPWEPIESLYAKLGVNRSRTDAPEHARETYGVLPVPRSSIPAGIILSRDAAAWIAEENIPHTTFSDASGKALKSKRKTSDGKSIEVEVGGRAIAVPLYQGFMMNQLIANRAGFGIASPTKWTVFNEFRSHISPKFAMGEAIASEFCPGCLDSKYLIRTIARTTDTRTIIGTPALGLPAGNSVLVLSVSKDSTAVWSLGGVLSSFAFDWQMRKRIAGTNVNQFFFHEAAVPRPNQAMAALGIASVGVAAPCWNIADTWLRLSKQVEGLTRYPLQKYWSIRASKRMEAIAAINAMAFALYGLSEDDVRVILAECDLPKETIRQRSKDLDLVGFWRVDKTQHPEHRQTVLSFIAFRDLREKIAANDGDVGAGIEAFRLQNEGEGWMLPQTLRLADYGLGLDDRAKEHQAVREYFGPRYYDWQLAQSAEESWKECHLHARNLLGEEGYARLLDELAGRATSTSSAEPERANGGQTVTKAATRQFKFD